MFANISCCSVCILIVCKFSKLDDTIHLLKDANKLNQFKNNALAHAKTFDLPNILPQYEAVYQELSLEMNK